MKHYFDVIFLIGMIIFIVGFIYYFISTLKTKSKKKVDSDSKSLFQTFAYRMYFICGHVIRASSLNEAVAKLRHWCNKKHLHLQRTGNYIFIYLNEKNRLRKMKRYDSAG